MAYFGPAKSSATEASDYTSQGQRHDRIHNREDGSTGGPQTTSSAAIETSISQKMLSAVSGSVLTSLLVTPLDVVRVRLQAQSSPSPSASYTEFKRVPPNLGVSACCREVFWVPNQSQFCVASPSAAAVDEMLISECAAEESQRRTFNSTLDGLRKIARNEGLTTLWRGLSPTLLMAVPANVIYFAGYDWIRANDQSPIKGRVSDTYAPLVAGSVARVMAAITVSPIEMLRTRMQASQSNNTASVMRETMTGLKEMVVTDGYRSLWRGIGLTFWRDVPFSAFYWWGYEYGREVLHKWRERSANENLALGERAGTRSRSMSDLSHRTVLIDSFVAGAASGAIAAFATTPFDVGKTRQQTVKHSKSNNAADFAKTSARQVPPEERAMPRFLWHIFRTEGAAGLFKGWAARCLKVAPACAIMISSYEIGKKMASVRNEKKELTDSE